MKPLLLKTDLKWISLLMFMLLGFNFTPVYADLPAMQLVSDESTLTFTATQNDAPVKGSFKNIAGSIHFDVKQLNQSNATITIETNSLTTAYKPIADSLKTEDWFDVKQFPEASFKSDKITKMDDTHYQADGVLSIRDKSKPIKVNFVLVSNANDKTKVKGDFTLKRLDFGLGQGEWASTDEIADPVKIEFEFSFSPK